MYDQITCKASYRIIATYLRQQMYDQITCKASYRIIVIYLRQQMYDQITCGASYRIIATYLRQQMCGQITCKASYRTLEDSYMTNEKKQEFTLRITQANKSQLIVLLYEIFLQYMEDAKDALADGQKDAFHRSMEKSIDCLRELTDSVQEKNELGRTVLGLYLYVSRQLGIALGSKKAEPLFEAEKVMRRLYEIYKEDAVNDTSDPIMQKSQQIYAGLTYGREDLTVSSQDGSSSRGFYA